MIKIKNIIILFSLILFQYSVFAQNNLDSLHKTLKNEKVDSIKVQILNQLSETYLNSDLDKALKHSKEAWGISKLNEFQNGLAVSNFNIGKSYEYMGKNLLAVDKFEKAIELFTQLNLKYELAETEKHLGIVYENLGKYDKALTHYLIALKKMEALNDNAGIASCLNSIGLIYYFEENYEEALSNFNKTLEIVTELNYVYAIAITYNNIGLVYENTLVFDTALIYYNKAIDIHKSIDNLYDIAIVYNNVANVFFKQDKYDDALKFYKEAMSIAEQLNDSKGISTGYINIGIVYKELEKYAPAEENFEKSLSISLETGDLNGSQDCYYNLSTMYAAMDQYENSLNAYLNYTTFKDSIFNKENSETVAQLQEKHNAEKKEQEIKLLNKDKVLQKNKIDQQKILIYVFIIVSIVILVFLIMLFRLFSQKKKANILLESQNIEIKHKNDVIEEKNKEIMDSIRYAQRIQEAILPPDKLVKETLSNSFVLFKPKDIVSGDFYWMEDKDGKILFSAVDCTGHGVPGAFMSIVGHNGLNQTVNEFKILSPSKILDKLNVLVTETLRQTDKQDVKDGMDMALCSLDTDKMILEYAGANNPLYLIRKKGRKFIVKDKEFEPVLDNERLNLFEIKATKQAIGASEDVRLFENHIINLEEGDTVIIFSDGYADQFGGPKGKKFKYKTFKKLLLDIEPKPMQEQRKILDNTIDEWRGELEQVDDICIIGVKF